MLLLLMKDKLFVFIGVVLTLLAFMMQIAGFSQAISFGSFVIGLILIVTISFVGRIDSLVSTFIIINTVIIAMVKIFEFITQDLIIQNLLLIALLTLNLILALISDEEKKKVRTKTKIILPRKEEELFFASKTGNSFHRRDCMTIRKVPREDLIVFRSRNEALEMGYKPCKVCRS